jgi:RNA polymerase sigma-70 factor (ECF subfamily)
MPSEIFTQLVDAHYTPLFRFALSLTKNSSDAGDLTQQTFFIWAKQGPRAARGREGEVLALHDPLPGIPARAPAAERVTALEDLGPVESDPPAPEIDVLAGLDANLVVEALAGSGRGLPDPADAVLSAGFILQGNCRDAGGADRHGHVAVVPRQGAVARGAARKEAGTRAKVVPFQNPATRKLS